MKVTATQTTICRQLVAKTKLELLNVDRRFWKFSSVKKVFKVQKDFRYDVKLRLLTHNRSFLANQKARNAIVGAENLLKFDR